MPISPMDEYLAHQTTDTFDYVFTSDRNFYDRYYFNCHPSNGELFLVADYAVPMVFARLRLAARNLRTNPPYS